MAISPAIWGSMTALGWGCADFIARFTGRRMGHDVALLAMLGVSAVILALVVWQAPTPFDLADRRGWPLLGLTGLGVMLATLLLYWGLARGPVTVVAPIVGSYPAFNVALAVVLGVRPSALQWLAMAAVMAGVLVVVRASRSFEDEADYPPEALRKTIWIAAASAALFGIAVAAGQESAALYGELPTTFAVRWIGFLALAVFLVARRGALRVVAPRTWWPLLALQGLLDGAAYVALFAAGGAPGAEMAAVVSSAFSAVTVILARVFLREAMTWSQWAGIALIVGGVGVLSS